MAGIRRIRPGGLSTDPSALDQPEALRIAQNVMLHRAGTAQPRPGFGDTTGVGSRATNYRPVRIVPFDGGLVVQSYYSSADAYRVEKGGANLTYVGGIAPPDTAIRGTSDFAQARQSLYFTTSTGVLKLDSVDATSTPLAGVFNDLVWPVIGETTATTDRYAGSDAAEIVAYRYCWVSTDSNGYVRRSAPSARFEYVKGAPKVWIRFDRIYLPNGIAAGDRIEFYRTEGSGSASTTPGTEYFLAVTYTVTSDDVSNGYITEWSIVDDVRDEMLGATLYTSPSQGGINNAKWTPPLANSLAWWANCMWYGNVTQRRSITLECVAVYDTANPEWDFVGLHRSSRTGDFTSGSTGVKNVSGVDGLLVGQPVTDASDAAGGPTVNGTYITAGTTIASIQSTNAITYASLADGDQCTIAGVTFVWKTAPLGSYQVAIGASASAAATNLANAINVLTWAVETGANIKLTATAGASSVTVVDANGNGIEITVTGTGQSVSYELSMSANARATGNTVAFTARDYIEINGVKFYTAGSGGAIATPTSLYDRPQLFTTTHTTGPSSDNLDLAEDAAINLAAEVNHYGIVSDTTFGIRAYYDLQGTLGDLPRSAFTLVTTSPNAAAFSVSSNRPTAWRPGLQSALTSEETRARHRVYYSAPEEPEAVPLLNFIDLGSSDRDILALVPLQDALLVFKEDGIWRITGSAPSSWVVDQLSAQHRLLAPACVTVLDGVCYAWTDRGVVVVTEGGVSPEPLSAPIANELRSYQRLLYLDNADPKRGAYMVAHPRLGLVILAVAPTSSAESSSTWYVFHTATRKWSTWTRADRCAAYDPVKDSLVIAPGVDAWTLLRERSDESGAASYRDVTISGIIGSTANSVITVELLTAFDPHGPPRVGDVVYDESKSIYARITAVTASPKYHLTIDSAEFSSALTFTWHQHIPCTLMWQAQTMPGVSTRWCEMHADLLDTSSAYVSSWPMTLGGATDRDSSATTVAATIDSAVTYSRPVRVGPPRAMVRAAQLYPQIGVACAGVRWRLGDVVFHGTPTSRRVRR